METKERKLWVFTSRASRNGKLWVAIRNPAIREWEEEDLVPAIQIDREEAQELRDLVDQYLRDGKVE